MAGKENTRFSRTFHQTFIPEKIYLSALLKYAANQGVYDAQDEVVRLSCTATASYKQLTENRISSLGWAIPSQVTPQQSLRPLRPTPKLYHSPIKFQGGGGGFWRISGPKVVWTVTGV